MSVLTYEFNYDYTLAHFAWISDISLYKKVVFMVSIWKMNNVNFIMEVIL